MTGPRRLAALILSIIVSAMMSACSSRTSNSIVPHTVQLVTPQSVSPGSITPGPMAKTPIQPSSAMRSPSTITTKSDIQGLNYSQIPGTASYAAAAPDGSLWVLSNAPAGPDKYIWHYANGTWTNISGLATRISVAPDGTLYAINSAGGAYMYSGGTWSSFGGGCRDLTAAADGSLYVISNGGGSDGAIWHYSAGAWTQQPGSGNRIAASWDTRTYSNPGGTITPGGFYVINSLGSIYYLGSAGYIQLPGAGSAVAPMNGGLFVLGYPTDPNGNVLYYYNLDNPGWSAKGGTGVSISTDGTHLYVIGAGGGIYVSAITSSIVISAGGTYSGNWQSLDPSVPAVNITTTAPVTIQNCTIQSKGELIRANVSNAHVTIRNCVGQGLDPLVAGKTRGNFFSAYDIGGLDLEHNTFDGVNFGVQLYDADGWKPDSPIVIRYNVAKNLDGAPSDGNGGRDLSHLAFGGEDNGNHFVILANLQNLIGTEIAWNEVDTAPGIASIGDVLDLYSSSGTAQSPIDIHDNFFHGGYPANPNATTYYAGGITMDGRSTDTAATATAFAKIHNNQIVAHANFGIGLVEGHDNEAYANRVVTSGQYADGSWYQGYVGIWIQNCVCTNQPPTVYYNNFAHDNTVGFRFEWASTTSPNVFSPPPVRQDYLLTDCAGGASGPTSRCTGNVSLPDPITSSTEANELTLWQQKLTANGITLGPMR